MSTTTFLVHAVTAALLGTAIGLERQWGQHTAGLRTNALVAFGASLFVLLPRLAGADTAAVTHLAGQVVTGVGFLGAGVIMREGVNIRGMNTSATLWCSAAIGVLVGSGLLLEGVVGACGILFLNIGLRPVSEWLDRRLRRAKNVATVYRIRATCRAGQEGAVRAVLFRFFHDHPKLILQKVATQEGVAAEGAGVVAEVYADQREDLLMEELMVLAYGEPSVISFSWERSPAV